MRNVPEVCERLRTPFLSGFPYGNSHVFCIIVVDTDKMSEEYDKRRTDAGSH